MKIAVAGIGYVGLSLAVLLARQHEVTAVDVDARRVDKLNHGESPIEDPEIKECLRRGGLHLTATMNPEQAYREADFLIVATPTNYDSKANYFDTSSVEAVLKLARDYGSKAWIVIKSTVPVGYTKRIRRELGLDRVLFSPEFLREGRALYDNLHPSRIVVGAELSEAGQREAAQRFLELLQKASLEKDVPTFLMDTTEAEAVKLFANTYLAMRVAYFNEMDTYADMKGLDTGHIIEGVCADPRIGEGYNNPSFGYGGYCLPKDSKQLLANYEGVPEKLISAIVDANRTRKDYLADKVLRLAGLLEADSEGFLNKEGLPVVGIYRLAMKTGSDNSRQSAVQGLIKRIRAEGVKLLIYEPGMQEGETVYGNTVTHDLQAFKDQCSVIVANRLDEQLDDVRSKVFTRDVFHRD